MTPIDRDGENDARRLTGKRPPEVHDPQRVVREEAT
jgi:hypothetical protein